MSGSPIVDDEGRAFGKHARVVEVMTDRYGRIFGRVYVGDTDVNRELVAQGFAWVYRKYSNDAELLELQAQAKEKGLGLWADPNPIPPWGVAPGAAGVVL